MFWDIALLVTGTLWLASLAWGLYRLWLDLRSVPVRLQAVAEALGTEPTPPPAPSAALDEAWERTIAGVGTAPLFPTLERWLGRKRLLAWLTRELQRAQVSWRASSVLALGALLTAFVGTVVLIATSALAPTLSPFGRLGVAIAVAAGVPLGGWAWLRVRQQRYIQRVETVLPDTLGLIANALRSGMSLQQALEIAGREGLPPLREEFAAVNRALVLGATLEEALQGLMDRVPSPELRLALVAVLVQREVGGSLAQIFETAAATIRRRIQLRRELRAETALVRFSAIALAFGLPAFLLLTANAVTYWQSGEAWSAPMFTDRVGQLALGLIAVLEAAGWLWLSSIINAMSE